MKRFPLLLLTLLATACSTGEPTIGEIAKADSRAYEQIAKQFSKGEDIAQDGEKLVKKGRKMIDDGRSDVRKGQEMILDGNKAITSIRNEYITQTPESLKLLEKANDRVEDGNARIIKGNNKIKTGEDIVRKGRSKIEEGNRIMSKSEAAYSAKQ